MLTEAKDLEVEDREPKAAASTVAGSAERE